MRIHHRHHLATSLLVSALGLAACGDDLAGPTPTPGRTVTGSQAAAYRLLDGTLLADAPADLWDTLVEAQVPRGTTWDVVPGTGHRDGAFTIDGLPDGHLWVRVARRPFGETFYWTDADHLAFDEDVVGPRDVVSSEEGDALRLAVDGLAPWQDDDELAWFIPEDLVFDMNLVSLTPPAVDTTDLAGASVDRTWRPIATAAAGDAAHLVQYRTRELAPGLKVRAPLRATQPVIQMTPGQDATLTATLAEPPPLAYHLAVARDAFEAQRTAVHPRRTTGEATNAFSLIALPGIVDGDLWIGDEYPVATLADPSVLQGTSPLDLGELAIPMPFPRAWLADLVVTTFAVDFPLPDGSPWTLEGVVGRRSTALASAAAPAAPAITPVRAPKLAAQDAFSELRGVGASPLLTWQPPAIGVPTAYRIQVIQAFTDPPDGYRPGWYQAAELIVPGDVTSIRLPADVLAPGQTYGLIVRAFAQPGQDVRTRPFQQRADAGFADAILGPFTP